jgi:hypothetical protein
VTLKDPEGYEGLQRRDREKMVGVYMWVDIESE